MKEIEFTLTITNCHIVDSYLITSRKDMKKFCKEILPDRFLRYRSVGSYVREWCAHNLLYNLHIGRDRTKDCDLNLDENIFKRFCYFILSLFYLNK